MTEVHYRPSTHCRLHDTSQPLPKFEFTSFGLSFSFPLTSTMDKHLSGTALREPDASILPHILLWLCQGVALACPTFRGHRVLSSTLIIALAIQCNLNPYFTKNFDLAQPFSLAWSFYLATLSKILFSGGQGPESCYWRIDHPAREATSYHAFGTDKLRWAAALIFNQRGIRWNHQVAKVPPSPHKSRQDFLAKQILKCATCFFMADLSFELYRRTTIVSGASHDATSGHSHLARGLVRMMSFGALPYFALNMQYSLGAFITVLLRISIPEVWVPCRLCQPSCVSFSKLFDRTGLPLSGLCNI